MDVVKTVFAWIVILSPGWAGIAAIFAYGLYKSVIDDHDYSLSLPASHISTAELPKEIKTAPREFVSLSGPYTHENLAVYLVHDEDQAFWRYKHPTIGDAYSSLLVQSPELLSVYLQGTAPDKFVDQRRLACTSSAGDAQDRRLLALEHGLEGTGQGLGFLGIVLGQ